MRQMNSVDLVRYIKWLSFIAIVVLLLVIMAYIIQFKESPISSDPEKWAFFGSYISGAVGAPLSFLGLIALLLTLQVQHLMLKQSEGAFKSQQRYLEQKEKKEEWMSIIRLAEGQIDKYLKTPVIKKGVGLTSIAFVTGELYDAVIKENRRRDKPFVEQLVNELYDGIDMVTLYRFGSLLGALFGYLVRYRSLLIEDDKDEIIGHYVSSYIGWYQRLEWIGVMSDLDCKNFGILIDGVGTATRGEADGPSLESGII